MCIGFGRAALFRSGGIRCGFDERIDQQRKEQQRQWKRPQCGAVRVSGGPSRINFGTGVSAYQSPICLRRNNKLRVTVNISAAHRESLLYRCSNKRTPRLQHTALGLPYSLIRLTVPLDSDFHGHRLCIRNYGLKRSGSMRRFKPSYQVLSDSHISGHGRRVCFSFLDGHKTSICNARSSI